MLSKTQVRRILKKHQIKSRSTCVKPFLNTKNMKKRFEWAKEKLDFDWSKVVFSDEKVFFGGGKTPKRVWRKDSQRLHPGFLARTQPGRVTCMVCHWHPNSCKLFYSQGLVGHQLHGKWTFALVSIEAKRSQLCVRHS